MKRRVLTGKAGAVAAGVLLGIGSFGVTIASAQDADQYAAIAFSTTTHAVGYAYDAASQEEAEAAALARCAEHADDCEARNACSALAIDTSGGGGWGAAWGNTYEEAAINAHDTCKEYNDSCQVYTWVCNSMASPD